MILQILLMAGDQGSRICILRLCVGLPDGLALLQVWLRRTLRQRCRKGKSEPEHGLLCRSNDRIGGGRRIRSTKEPPFAHYVQSAWTGLGLEVVSQDDRCTCSIVDLVQLLARATTLIRPAQDPRRSATHLHARTSMKWRQNSILQGILLDHWCCRAGRSGNLQALMGPNPAAAARFSANDRSSHKADSRPPH
jgi:hypothetical protein